MLSSGACHIPQRRLALPPAHPVGVLGQGPQNTGVQAPIFSNHLAFRVGPGCTPPEVSGRETWYCNTCENRLLGSCTWGILSGPDAQGERVAPSNCLNKLSALLLWIHSNLQCPLLPVPTAVGIVMVKVTPSQAPHCGLSTPLFKVLWSFSPSLRVSSSRMLFHLYSTPWQIYDHLL